MVPDPGEELEGAFPPPYDRTSLESSSLCLRTTGTSSATTTAASTEDDKAETSSAGETAKRGRRSRPKVKTGCGNCKYETLKRMVISGLNITLYRQRRIKCDELRPSCSQCVKSSKVCNGYPPPPRSARPYEEVRIAPRPVPLQPGPGTDSSVSSIRRSDTPLPPRRAQRILRSTGPSPVQGRGVIFPPPSQGPPLYQPSNSLPFGPVEAQYFEVFQSRTAAELSGVFDRVFWTERVLQECHNATAISRAVVALGALYKTLEQSSGPVPTGLPARSNHINSITAHWQVAVKNYSEACKAMVHNDQTRSSQSRLMAIVLLACFDSFIGDHKQAIIQIQTGLGLLQQLQAFRRQQTGQPLEICGDELEKELMVVFMRLVIQAKSYDLAFHFPEPYTVPAPPSPEETSSRQLGHDSRFPSPLSDAPVALSFATVLEARIAADKINVRTARFVERLRIAQKESSNVLPEAWQQYVLQFREHHEAWTVAFEPLLRSRHSPEVSYLERAAILALKMSQLNALLLLITIFYSTEGHFDQFMPYFEAILAFGLEIVREEESRAASEQCPNPLFCPHRPQVSWDPFSLADYTAYHIKPSFSADLGIVPPLFVVATKCRDPTIRRRAIQLLRSSARREAMWDSAMAAQVAEWIMQREEAGLQVGAPMSNLAARIPEPRRIMIKTVDFDLRAHHAHIRVGTRGLPHGLPDDRFGEARITW
ncbi:hypothetical protein S40285_04920 [Stachybotrys chlorohalonatus IBT 40285]|uniref:Zn(2)-C6 fungal-type domain-containing protein n=1 Tax=Stachybotrys chlorohalonatus (strain IBT 40285) TaxID=1283841 RepID=A0A084QGZ1_STAC4|nr:hypothetical protein S40285_04920 [Stachybotrys chlorohalonata IBT 40285]